VIEKRTLPLEYQDMAERYMKYNVELAGEFNEARPLSEFKFVEGFVFVSESNKQAWRVTRAFPEDGQTFMRSLDGTHQLLVDNSVKFKLP